MVASADQALRFGMVGAGAGRGGPDQLLAQMRNDLPAFACTVSALCDPDESALTAAAAAVGLDPEERCFTDYIAMLDSGLVDAVVIATPMEFHAAQTIEALGRNIHVLCEVTAAVTVAECRAVVKAASCSNAHYAMAENFLYSQYAQVVARLVEEGRFGEPHYAEGEYLAHGAYPSTVWRRKWMVGRKGVTCKGCVMLLRKHLGARELTCTSLAAVFLRKCNLCHPFAYVTRRRHPSTCADYSLVRPERSDHASQLQRLWLQLHR